MMKYLFFILIFVSHAHANSIEHTIAGKVERTKGCSEKVMVWLSLDKEDYQERLLLMHTEVPLGGTFRFHVRPGDYQVRASDKDGCEFLQRVSVKGEDPFLAIKMVKK